jgi:hypothetical protein
MAGKTTTNVGIAAAKVASITASMAAASIRMISTANFVQGDAMFATRRRQNKSRKATSCGKSSPTPLMLWEVFEPAARLETNEIYFCALSRKHRRLRDGSVADCFCRSRLKIMSRVIPFTVASLARAIKGVEQAGRFVIGVKPDGTLIVGDKPVETTSLVPSDAEVSPPPRRRLGERLNGGQGAVGRS